MLNKSKEEIKTFESFSSGKNISLEYQFSSDNHFGYIGSQTFTNQDCHQSTTRFFITKVIPEVRPLFD